jgi:hypothetical protein
MSASDAYYQSAKGGIAMRVNNAEQLAQGREGLITSREAQQLTLDDDVEHAKANRDASIFGLSLGGSGAYKVAYGVGKAIGGRYLDRGLARLQNAVDEYKRFQDTTPDAEPSADAPATTTTTSTTTTDTGVGPLSFTTTDTGVGPDAPTYIRDTAVGSDVPTPLRTADVGIGVRPTTQDAATQAEDAPGDPFSERLYRAQPEPEDPLSPSNINTSRQWAQARGGRVRELEPLTSDVSQPVSQQAQMAQADAPPPTQEAQAAPAPDEPPTPATAPGPAPDQPPSTRTTGITADEPVVIPQDQAQDAGDAIQAAGRPNTSIMSDAQNARLTQIQNSDPILNADHVGQLKKLGVDLGDLTPDEVDTGARMILGDTAVEGLSTALGIAGSVVGAALPVIGTIGDIAGLAFAAKGLFDSADAVAKEQTQKQQLDQAIAKTNIPVQVATQGAAPVLDSATNRIGGFQNY